MDRNDGGTRTMIDTVVLAAGQNTRLGGIVAPGLKPLLVINGKSLLRHAVETAPERVVVVASPQNALALSSVLPPYPQMILQREPRGPGNALYIGLQLVTTDEVLVLLGDNLTSAADVRKIIETPGNAVGVRSIEKIELETIERFTRQQRDGRWVEKIPPSPDDLWDDMQARVWLGPIKISVKDYTVAVLRFLEDAQHQGWDEPEIPIGPLFNQLDPITLVEVDSVDVGVPEELP